jgi:hypothetical protein
MITFASYILAESKSQMSAQPKDVQGWNKTKWGMTDEQIRTELIGNRVEPYTETEKFKDFRVNLWIKNLEIDDYQYEVLFQMDDLTNQLSRVLIRPSENKEIYVKFKSLDQMLMEKYGLPNDKDDHYSWYIQTYKHLWKFPTTTIELRYSELKIPKVESILSLTYHPSTNEDNI